MNLFFADEFIRPVGKLDVGQPELGEAEVLGVEFGELQLGRIEVVPPVFKSLTEAVLEVAGRPGQLADVFAGGGVGGRPVWRPEDGVGLDAGGHREEGGAIVGGEVDAAVDVSVGAREGGLPVRAFGRTVPDGPSAAVEGEFAG